MTVPQETTSKKLPNILITGTPGTGKTTTTQLLLACLEGIELAEVQEPLFNGICIGQLVKEHGYHLGFNEEFNTFILDEDRVLDHLEGEMEMGGRIVDHHGCDFFPERWFDLVVVLTCDNTVLYDRLQARNYRENKIQENVQCEIMQVVLEEARENYKKEIIAELSSNNLDEMQSNVERIEEWIKNYMASS